MDESGKRSTRKPRRNRTMKIKTNTKAGGLLGANHNQTLRVKSGV